MQQVYKSFTLEPQCLHEQHMMAVSLDYCVAGLLQLPNLCVSTICVNPRGDGGHDSGEKFDLSPQIYQCKHN